MKVRELLEIKGHAVATASPSTSVKAATQMMNERRIVALVVVENDKLVGIFTERDVLIRVVAAGLDPARTTVGEVMTKEVLTCPAETSLEECRRIFTERRIRHLPVVESGKLVGVVTTGDILAQEVREHEKTIQPLEDYIRNP
ncbi:MAG: CBS domain-containing protein [Candidatus Sumerlaeaceae bacterium]